MSVEQQLSPRSLAAQQEGQNHTCQADIPFTDEELAFLNRESRALFSRMPLNGPGFECYGYGSAGNHHYGRSSTLQATKHICAQWAQKHPQGPRIGVGDISLPNGGDTRAHKSHEEGVDVDFSVIANNGKEEPSDWRHGNYSQALTQEFVDLVWANPVLKPSLIYFNDPQIKGVKPCGGHDNHLHVRFSLGENIGASSHSPDSGTLRLMTPFMKGDRVKSLQLGLAKAGIAIGTDSLFGKDTESAVKKFQLQQGLKADGVAGANTLAKLAEVIASDTIAIASEPDKTVSVSSPSPDEDTLQLASPLMKSDQVKSLQMGLAKAGIAIKADGVFGKGTESAVKQFQTQHGLTADGVANENTRVKFS